MNYSVFSIQNKAGKTGIFWEKESVPKKDKKFGYKKKEQRFPIRRHVNDTHQEDRGFGTLTPDDAPPPPKPPAKNFIKRNREHIAALKQKKDQNSTVTLTQEQLNAILKSVGKVADNSNDRHEISIESPQRNDDDDDYDDHREKRRPKKKSTKRQDENEEEPASIYSLLGKKDQPKGKSQERETKPKRREEDDYDDRRKKDRYRSKQRDDDDYDENLNDRDNKRRQNRSKYRDDDIDSDRDNRTRKNRSKHHDDYDSDDDVELDNRHRRSKPKQRDYDEEYDDDYKDRGHKGHNRNSEKSDKSRTKDRKKERKDSKDRDSRTIDIDVKNVSGDKLEPLEVSPRDKVGLPNDLSWRHMTKAERLRLTVARNKLVEEEEKKEEDRIQSLMVKYGGMEPSPLMKPAPEKKRATKSDPDRHTRHERSHTEESNYTDYRRGRRSPSGSRSRTPDRSRTPERSRPRSRTPELHHSSPYSSPKGDKPPGIPRQHMTLAEKKRIEWERDRVESVQIQRHGEFDPWGRPGAGAPLRTRSGHIVADYKNRQVRKASYAGKVMMMY